MPFICYKEKNFRAESLALIEQINSIVAEYDAMGYDLTLRQVYYQLVSRDVIPNNERSYKNLGNLINDGRLAGLIDWYAIIDRTRNLRSLSHWEHGVDMLGSAAAQFRKNHWEGQPNYVEVWVEKDALVGVVGDICNKLDVPYFSCRGYTSQSEMWTAAQRFRRKSVTGEKIILHLGDHDPSGIDMSRDIAERLEMFGADVYVQRIALTMEQIEEFAPPPNPAKLTDSRCRGYIQKYGHESWELDALNPTVITELIRDNVWQYVDRDRYNAEIKSEQRDKDHLKALEQCYPEALNLLLENFEGNGAISRSEMEELLDTDGVAESEAYLRVFKGY